MGLTLCLLRNTVFTAHWLIQNHPKSILTTARIT